MLQAAPSSYRCRVLAAVDEGLDGSVRTSAKEQSGRERCDGGSPGKVEVESKGGGSRREGRPCGSRRREMRKELRKLNEYNNKEAWIKDGLVDQEEEGDASADEETDAEGEGDATSAIAFSANALLQNLPHLDTLTMGAASVVWQSLQGEETGNGSQFVDQREKCVNLMSDGKDKGHIIVPATNNDEGSWYQYLQPQKSPWHQSDLAPPPPRTKDRCSPKPITLETPPPPPSREPAPKLQPSLTLPGSRAEEAEAPPSRPIADAKKPSLQQRRGLKCVPMIDCKAKAETTLDALPNLEAKYDVLETLGSGSTSTVKQAVRKSDGVKVALKIMRSMDHEMISAAKHEYETMLPLMHLHIIRAMDFGMLHGKATLVLEFFEGSTLNEAVHRMPQQKIPECKSKVLAAQLLSAICYIHGKGVLHRDIKPENTLVPKDLEELKLMDFNVAARSATALTPAGTAMYMAPEVLVGEPSSSASDVWSAGLCIFLMLSGKLPQHRDREHLTREALVLASKEDVLLEGSDWEPVPEVCKKLLKRCLVVEDGMRPSAQDAMLDTWFVLG